MLRSQGMSRSIILADEPTGDLDTKTGNEVVLTLRNLAKSEHVTVLVVTHDPIVAQMVDRLIEMRDGKIVGKRVQKIVNS